MPHPDGHTISWEVVTHVHKEHTADWYWALGLVALVGAVASVWLGNILFAIIIVIGAGSLGTLAARGPRQHSVHIDAKGITIDTTLYAFQSIKSFWVDYGNDVSLPTGRQARLYLMTHGIMAPHITLPLESVSQGEQIRSYLRPRVSEVEQEPHFGEHILELIGL